MWGEKAIGHGERYDMADEVCRRSMGRGDEVTDNSNNVISKKLLRGRNKTGVGRDASGLGRNGDHRAVFKSGNTGETWRRGYS